MKFFQTACKDGDEEISSSPMVYTRLQMLLAFIDSLPEEPVNKDLEEAKEQAWFNYEYRDSNGRLYRNCFEDGFELGANWQEQQDEKDTSDMLTVTYLRGGDEGKKIMVDKACEWLEENLINYWGQLFANYYGQINANDTEQFIKNFRKAMEE